MTVPPPPPNPYPGPGEILDDKYRVEKLLGEGGMGAVARATHLMLHRTVAVKFMNPQFMSFPGAVERFLNEGHASGAIKSDHVVPVTDVGCLPTGTPYLVMECLDGLDLADLLARDGPKGLPTERAVHFLVQVLRGLQAAHAIGIIHRDMKPSNCFVVTNDGEEDFIKILDFGISKVVQPGSASLTQTNSALGTPLYMSPEQARSPRDVDARSDLYSVGVILYELLSARTPFFSESGEFTEILFQLFTKDPPPIRELRPDVPEALAEVVHKALAREVADRYISAVEMAEALGPFASPKTLALIARMRAFKAPTKDSIAPAPDLPTSIAAFSQLRKGHGTDVMANRPSTDLQRGAPGTELLEVAPRIPQKTAALPPPAKVPGQLTPAAPGMRARPEDALGRTQLDFDSRPPQASAAKSVPPNRTDLGASRDAVVTAVGTDTRRSPFVFVVPVVALAVIGGAGFFAMNRGKTVPPVVATSDPSQTGVSTTPPRSAEPIPTVPPSASTAAAPSAAPSASASASAPVVKKPPSAHGGSSSGAFGLDHPIKQ